MASLDISKESKFILIASSIAVVFFVFVSIVIFFRDPEQSMSENEILALNNRKDNAETVLASLSEREIVRPVGESDHLDGDLNAPVKLIVYSDFSCPFCPGFNETLKRVKTEFKGQVVVAYRHFVTPGSPLSPAMASECAAEQGRFLPMYDLLFGKSGKYQIEEFRLAAAELKLEMGDFNRCLEGGGYEDKIKSETEEVKRLGVIGAPAIFVNDGYYPGAYPFEDFEDSQGNKLNGLKNIILGELE